MTVNPVLGWVAPDWLAWARGGVRVRSLMVAPSAADLDLLAGWVDDGRLRPLIDRRYLLADAREAQRFSASERARGKLILTVNQTLAEHGGAPVLLTADPQVAIVRA